MSGPFLPLSKEQIATIVRTLDEATEPGADAGGGSEKLPRIPEKTVVALVRVLLDERANELPGDAKQDTKTARKRARRMGALTGLAGLVGQLPAEGVQLIEEARAAIDIAAVKAPSRTDTQIAADLLVLWGLVDDVAAAEALTAGTSDGSLLDRLYATNAEKVRDAIPEKWTPIATLKFLWKMRELRDVADLMPGGIVRNIPVVGALPTALGAGREMKHFQKDLERHYGTLGQAPLT